MRDMIVPIAATLVVLVYAACLHGIYTDHQQKERRQAVAAMQAVMKDCPEGSIRYQTGGGNDGGVAWFTLRCEVTHESP